MKKPFKIECEVEEINTILTALYSERIRAEADEDNKGIEELNKAIEAVREWTTNR